MDDSSADRNPVEALAEEYLDRHRRGERPAVAEYTSKHPDLADEIEDLFPALLMMEDIRPGSGDATGMFAADGAGSTPKLEQVGDYRILREVGRGGMGVVYEALHESLGRRVAVKVLPRHATLDQKQLRRFEREVKSAARLHHTNIVPIFGAGHEDETHYYVMQFIQGLGLDEVLTELKRLRADGNSGSSIEARRSELGGPAPERDTDRNAGREVSAVDVARSLLTGHFEPERPHDSDSDRRASESAAPPAAERSGPSSVDLAGPITQGDPGIETASGRLSETFSLSSVSLPGQSESTDKARARQTYWQSVANLGVQVAGALEYAHENGILHRDVKPSNLLLDNWGTVWVTDFGLAKADDQQDITHTGDIIGTLRYMPPEAFEGKTDVRSDVYSLGLTLYEMLSLQPAFPESDRNRLIKRVTEGGPARLDRVNPEVPRDLATIVHKAIDRERTHRYSTAGEFAADLSRFISDEPIKARRVSLTERAVRWSRRNRGLAASLATCAALVMFLAIGSTWAASHFRELAANNEQLADEKGHLAEENDAKRIEALAAKHAAEDARTEIQAQQELTRRNLYSAEINMAGMATAAGDLERQEELLAHWRTRDEATDLRGWEWYFLQSSSHDEHQVLHGNGHPITSVDWSPDGTRIAAGRADGTLMIRDLRTERIAQMISGHNGPVYGLDWSPDARRLVSCGGDPTIKIWDAGSGQELLAIRGHDGAAFHVAWDPQGKRVASTSRDGTARVWDGETGAQLAVSSSKRSGIQRLSWHPDGSRIASGENGPDVVVWDARTGAELERFTGHKSRSFSVAWDHAGARLASGGADGKVLIWEQGESTPRTILTGHQADAWITSVAWSPDGARLASTSTDRMLKLWDVDKGVEVHTFRGHTKPVIRACWNPSGTRLASAGIDQTVRIWDVRSSATESTLTGHAQVVRAVDWTPDGRFVVSGSQDGTIRLWDVRTGEVVRRFTDAEVPFGAIWTVRFSPDGTRVAAGGFSETSTVRIWHVESGKIRSRLSGAAAKRTDGYQGINDLAWHPDGVRLVAANADSTIYVWRTETEELEQTLIAKSNAASVAFAPNGRWIASGHWGGSVRLWDLDTGQLVAEVENPAQHIYSVAFGPDGKRLAAGGGRWRRSSGPLVLNSASGVARFWDVVEAEGAIALRNQVELRGHGEIVLSVCFDAQGQRLATASADRSVRLWDVTPTGGRHIGRQLMRVDGHDGNVWSVRFGPDGTRLASGSNDRTVKIWDAYPSYAREKSPLLLATLDRRIGAGTASTEDYRLRAEIHARQANWTAAAADFEKVARLRGDSDWFTTGFWITGPYPPQRQREYAPERLAAVRDFDLLRPLEGPPETTFQRQYHWRRIDVEPGASVDFGAYFDGREYVSGYALMRVYAPRDNRVGVIYGADDTHRLWLNGALVHESGIFGTLKPDEFGVPLSLRAGWNTLLVKVVNSIGQHGLSLRFSDEPYELAPAYERTSRLSAAAELWDGELANDPKNPSLLLKRAVALWKAGKRPQAERDFALALESSTDELALRLRRANIYRDLGLGKEAITDLDRAIELDPDELSLRSRCADLKVRMNLLEDGEKDLTVAVEGDPTDHWNRFGLTALRLELGDEVGYRALCREMLDRWGDTKDPMVAERTAKSCLLAPIDGEDLQKAVALADRAIAAGSRHRLYGWFLLAKGMADYRVGADLRREDESPSPIASVRSTVRRLGAGKSLRSAVTHLSAARRRLSRSRLATIHIDLFLALAHHRLGNGARASTLLERAYKALRAETPQPGDDFGSGVYDLLRCRITFREAGAEIVGPAFRSLEEAERLLADGDDPQAIELLAQALLTASNQPALLEPIRAMVDEGRFGFAPLLATSQTRPVEWQYRFTKPGEQWSAAIRSDDADWKTGPAPFGSYDDPFKTSTTWNDADRDIWLRTEFEVTEAPNGPLAFLAYIDEEAEIYLNGIPAAEGIWGGYAYRQLNCAPKATRTIRVGKNVLAVHCSNPRLGAWIDVGLYETGSGDLYAAVLTKALEASSEQPVLVRVRGARHLLHERWGAAAGDYATVASLEPDNVVLWLGAASLFVLAGDQAGYERLCHELLARSRETDSFRRAETTAMACLLAPGLFDRSQLPMSAITGPLDDGSIPPQLRASGFTTRALAAYRSGDIAGAEKWIREATSHIDETGSRNLRALVFVIRSLVGHSAGHPEDARRLLDEATALVKGRARNSDGNLIGRSLLGANRNPNHNLLIAEILRREAEALLASKPNPNELLDPSRSEEGNRKG